MSCHLEGDYTKQPHPGPLSKRKVGSNYSAQGVGSPIHEQLFLGRAVSIQGEAPCRYVSFHDCDKYMRKSIQRSNDWSGLVISEVSEMAALPLCYRPMLKQNIMVVRHMWEQSPSPHSDRKHNETQMARNKKYPTEPCPQWPTSSDQASSSSNESINGLIHWLGPELKIQLPLND